MAIKWTDTTRPEPLPQRPLAANGPTVWIAPAVERAVRAHLAGGLVERGGLLIGIAFADPASGAVSEVGVLDSVAAGDADGTPVSLRMAPAVWSAAQARIAAAAPASGDHPRRIVGWYHSHPGLTAFFSDTDRQTQRAFFAHDYSIGWVIDPINDLEALFVGADCAPIPRGPAPT
ncbi:MAG: Mov34/MPN/PAD-1 family protein [Lautropia sp.]